MPPNINRNNRLHLLSCNSNLGIATFHRRWPNNYAQKNIRSRKKIPYENVISPVWSFDDEKVAKIIRRFNIR